MCKLQHPVASASWLIDVTRWQLLLQAPTHMDPELLDCKQKKKACRCLPCVSRECSAVATTFSDGFPFASIALQVEAQSHNKDIQPILALLCKSAGVSFQEFPFKQVRS